MSRRLLLILSVGLQLLQLSQCEDSYLFPAAQVLSFLSDVDWGNEATVALVKAVAGKVRSEYLQVGSERIRGFSDHMIGFLKQTSELSAKQQMEAIVEKILADDELILPGSKDLMHKFLEEIKDSKTQLNKILTNTLPLIYN